MRAALFPDARFLYITGFTDPLRNKGEEPRAVGGLR